ncbi:hypothetical protein [Lysobacter sp. FW306-1B-D06B]|uniref:hypothetical protein n=1 Tax=Lysobacter sp. FW306-1B-D06B TaxID=3140250 RepID=UPI0031402BF7
MRFAACVVGIVALFAVGIVAAASPGALSVDAQRHVTRFSDALNALSEGASGKRANVQANRALELLVKDISAAGDEALAALAGHYLGESTEPECEILARGARMLPLLMRFTRNPPTVHLPASPVHSRSELIDQINNAERCD